MTGETIPNGRGVQALYHNIMQAKLRGFGTVPGNAPTPSVSSTDRAVDITAGEVLVDGDRVTVDAQTTDTRTGDTDPRRDVWYIDANGDLKVKEGTPAAPLQEQLDRGESTFELYEPHPPDSTTFTGVVVAEAYIPAGATDFQASEFLDLTVASKVDVDRYDGDKFILGENDDFRLSYEDDTNTVELTDLSSGTTFTWESDGDHDIPGDLSVGGGLTLGSAFNPDTITPDVLRIGSESILPVYADNANAVASDASVWFNDGTGPNSAGIYYYDGGVVGPLATGAGSSPSALSGLSIDVTKDWGGYFLTNVGHDGVRVPSSVNRVIDGFEEGRLDPGYTGDLLNEARTLQVQSSTVLKGDYSLQAEYPGSGAALLFVPAYFPSPQPGDEFTVYFMSTDASDKDGFGFAGDPAKAGSFEDLVSVRAQADGDSLNVVDHYTGTSDSAAANVSGHLNETLRVECLWEEDLTLTVTLYVDATDTELASASITTGDAYRGRFCWIRDNRDSNTTTSSYFDQAELTRRTREHLTESKTGVVELGGEVVDPAGTVATGPQETPPNPGKTMRTIVPVNDQATQGAEQGTVDDIAGAPVWSETATADGQGGAYARQADGPVGRIARVNANLSWEYDTVADLTDWKEQIGATHSTALIGRPRRLQVSHDGSGSDNFGGFKSAVRTHPDVYPRGFILTFHDVSYTNNDALNRLRLGFGDQNADTDVLQSGNGVFYAHNNNGDYVRDVDSGTSNSSTGTTVDWSQNHDISLLYDLTTAYLLVDGYIVASVSSGVTGAFTPILQVEDDGSASASETLEVEQLTMEVL